MVYRIYVEKRPGLAQEAEHLLRELSALPGVTRLTGLRLLNRYDAEGISEELFDRCVPVVFSEPQLDVTFAELPSAQNVFAVEYLPGQFDQRADSAEECIQLISRGERPVVRSAKVYLLEGDLSAEELAAVKKDLINPVEAREASLEKPATLALVHPVPPDVPLLTGFTKQSRPELEKFCADYGLAMDTDDAAFCSGYFASEHRDPTLAEIRMIDTYWSDHCRHTTFGTVLENVVIGDPAVQKSWDAYLDIRRKLGRTKPVTLMDIATIGAKELVREGKLTDLDESEEINACTIKVRITADGEPQDWLLLFKNETHNHPTEIEPFGGAATCIGGAIRDPLSGRAYVYQAMRVTGAADPLTPLSETMPGKLPQRKLVTTAAAGYSSYGNQIGLATGHVHEFYHPGYAAKRMEIGAVIGAVPRENVVRSEPDPGDIVILLGGRTGRDGIGGATGSSKAHNLSSLSTCGAEVQKGNAPVERKLQRLFRSGEVTRMIKRCNDFGAGGVSVAVGELADGLDIDLDAVPKKYDGLDGTELAISESQERMAVVVAPQDEEKFIGAAHAENLEATPVAKVTAAGRLVMHWRGRTIIDLSREFLNSNGAPKRADAEVGSQKLTAHLPAGESVGEKMRSLVGDLNVCSEIGLTERFDSTIGAGTVLMPYGGRFQQTPAQAMAAKLPVLSGNTDDCSGMACGFDPYLSAESPYRGAYLAVDESISRLVAAGFPHKNVHLTFQEYFERLGTEPSRWGKPLASLLGALQAQTDFGAAAIGGKDSMSGSFEKLDVPPTLVSFAVAMGKAHSVISDDFKLPGSQVVWIAPAADDGYLPDPQSQLAVWDTVGELIAGGGVLSAWAVGAHGIAEGLFKMGLGSRVGFRVSSDFDTENLFGCGIGGFLLEMTDEPKIGTVVGETTGRPFFEAAGEKISLEELRRIWENKLEPVFPYHTPEGGEPVRPVSFKLAKEKKLVRRAGCEKPKVLIPVFPGTNCEYDTARAVTNAGGEPQIFVVNNLSPEKVEESAAALAKAIRSSQIIVLPGGFSGGDEPDGSGKLINAFFRSAGISDAVMELLEKRDGLMLGICNGFQALIKLGLVPAGRIMATDAGCPTLTFNTIGRHQSMLVNTRISSDLSPWMSCCETGQIYTIPVSHGEGRFVADAAVLAELEKNGQIAAQYVDPQGVPTMDVRYNPNGSAMAVEAITSPDGRVLGKMGHCERTGADLYRNVPGNEFEPIFRGGIGYYRL